MKPNSPFKPFSPFFRPNIPIPAMIMFEIHFTANRLLTVDDFSVSGGVLHIEDLGNDISRVWSTDSITHIKANGDDVKYDTITGIEGKNTLTLTSLVDFMRGDRGLIFVRGLQTENVRTFDYAFASQENIEELQAFSFISATKTRLMFSKVGTKKELHYGDVFMPNIESAYSMFTLSGFKTIGNIHMPKATNTNSFFSRFSGDKIGDVYAPKSKQFKYFIDKSTIKKIGKITSTAGEKFNYFASESKKLECIRGLDTRNQTDTYRIFYQTDSLNHPTADQQTNLENGALYENLTCSANFEMLYTNPNVVMDADDFTVEGGTVAVEDMGNDVYRVWSEDNITRIRVEEYAVRRYITQVEGKATSTLTNGERMFYNFKELLEIITVNTENITSMKHMCGSLLKLTVFPDFDYTKVTNAQGAFQDIATAVIPHLYLPVAERVDSIIGRSKVERWGGISAPLATNAYTLAYDTKSLKEVGDIYLPEATALNYGFRYSPIEKMGKMTTPKVEGFEQMFKGAGNQGCIQELDTRAQTDTSDMFTDSDFVKPTALEQAQLLNGALYENQNDC